MSHDFFFGQRSKAELVGVHPHLVLVTSQALIFTEIDFAVHDGIRTKEEQKELVARGVSWTMNSRHLTGHAVDLVPYIANRLSWDSIEAFKHLGACMREAADKHEVPIIWGANVEYGGDWKKINDMAHFELDRRKYPA